MIYAHYGKDQALLGISWRHMRSAASRPHKLWGNLLTLEALIPTDNRLVVLSISKEQVRTDSYKIIRFRNFSNIIKADFLADLIHFLNATCKLK